MKAYLLALLAFATSASAMAQATNRFADPAKAPPVTAPAAGASVSGVTSGALPAPGMPVPGAGALPPMPSQPSEVVETVPARRVGKVNGEYLYKGEGATAYLFESTKKSPVVRKPETPAMTQARLQAAALAPNLPSAVGSPSQASAPPMPTPAAAPTTNANQKPAARPALKK